MVSFVFSLALGTIQPGTLQKFVFGKLKKDDKNAGENLAKIVDMRLEMAR